MSNLYERAFVHVLKEAPMTPMEDMSDEDAMASTLDKGTQVQDFNPDAQMATNHAAAVSQLHQKMNKELSEWIEKLEDFGDFLNGVGPNSMQSKLKHAVEDTLFDKIRNSETKKIARVAMEVSSLSELLKGFSASSGSPSLRGV